MQKTSLYIFVILFTSVFFSSSLLAATPGYLLENFSPNSYQDDFTVTEPTKTLKTGEFSLTLFYDTALNSLSVYDDSSNVAEDQMSFLNLNLSYGLTDRWELGLRAPYLINQSLSESQQTSTFNLVQGGISNAVLYTKYRFLKSKTVNIAASFQLGKSFDQRVPYIGEGSGLYYSGLLSLDRVLFSKYRLGVNAGYTLFSPGDVGVDYLYYEPIESTLNASVALSRKFFEKNRISLEYAVKKHDIEFDGSDRNEMSGEAFLSYARKLGRFNLIAGAGYGMQTGVSEPEMRYFAGLNYKFSLFNKKKDETGDDLSENLEAIEKPPEEMSDEVFETPEAEEVSPDFQVNQETGSEESLTEGMDYNAPETDEEAIEEDVFKEEEDLEDEPYSYSELETESETDFNSEITNDSEPLAPSTDENTQPLVEDEDDYSFEEETVVENSYDQESNAVTHLRFKKILFYFDSYKLRPEGVENLNNLISYLEEHPYTRLEIWGHTDSVGSQMYNEKLSLYRAYMVRSYLIKVGKISKDKIKADGWGYRRPAKPNTSPENRFQNRRVEFIIYDK